MSGMVLVLGQYLVRVREQPMGGYVASVDMPDGRRLRVCGTSDAPRKDVVAAAEHWVTWVRRGSRS